MRLELEAVESGRVVAGGNHHAADGALVLDRKGNRGRRRGLWRQHDLEAIAGEYFRGTLGKLVREKPPVIADDDLLAPCQPLDLRSNSQPRPERRARHLRR